MNFKVELVDKFIMSFFEKGILKEEEEKHTKIRNEQGVTTNTCYNKVLYVSRLMNLLLSEIGDFLEKKIIRVNATKILLIKPSGRPERSIINEEMEKSI